EVVFRNTEDCFGIAFFTTLNLVVHVDALITDIENIVALRALTEMLQVLETDHLIDSTLCVGTEILTLLVINIVSHDAIGPVAKSLGTLALIVFHELCNRDHVWLIRT